jgi:hypothetical protein
MSSPREGVFVSDDDLLGGLFIAAFSFVVGAAWQLASRASPKRPADNAALGSRLDPFPICGDFLYRFFSCLGIGTQRGRGVVILIGRVATAQDCSGSMAQAKAFLRLRHKRGSQEHDKKHACCSNPGHDVYSITT